MKELKLQFILLSAQQAVQLHYYWSGTDCNVIINSEIKIPEKKSALSKNIPGEKKEQVAETTIEHNFL